MNGGTAAQKVEFAYDLLEKAVSSGCFNWASVVFGTCWEAWVLQWTVLCVCWHTVAGQLVAQHSASSPAHTHSPHGPFPPRGFTLSRLPPLALPQVPVSSVFTQNEMIDAIAITKGHVRGCCCC